MGRAGFSKKTSAPLSLMKTYRMSLISAGSITLESTFNFFNPFFANFEAKSAQIGSK
jgi:hypothetical protein